MTTAYNFRIVAALPGEAAVELFRSRQPYNQSYWNFYTRGMDRGWSIWVEHVTIDRHTLTPRVRFARPTGARLMRVHLSREEKAEAGI